MARTLSSDGEAVASPSARHSPACWVVVEWSGGGGIGHYSFLLADGLRQLGVRTVLATRLPHELGGTQHAHEMWGIWPRPPGVLRGRIRRVAIAIAWAIGCVRLFARLATMRGLGRRLVAHVQAPETLAEVVLLALLRLTGATTLVTAHNALPHDSGHLGRSIHRLTYRLPHAIITQTPVEAGIVRSIATRGKPVVEIPHGSYAPIADAFATAAPARDSDPSHVVVGHLGTIRPYKGFDLVVEAFGVAYGMDPRLRLRVAGKPADEHSARAMLERLPRGSWTADLRHLSLAELVAEAQAADIAFLGHRRASVSGILHLTLASGAIAVAPDIAGIHELLEQHPDLVYEPDDVHDAARTLVAVAAEVRADREECRRRAREIADERCPVWSTVAALHLDVWDELCRTRA